MTLQDGPGFRALVRTVSAGRGKPMSDTAMDGLWLLVADMAWEDFERGFVGAARETRFFPTPADIRAYAAKARADAAVTPDMVAMAANGELHCERCSDTGWAPCTLDARHVYGDTVEEVWSGEQMTRSVVPGEVPRIVAEPAPRYVRGRFDPAAVPAVRVCGCRASNPRYQAIRATTRRVGQSSHE
jgi:hypothetical protein